MFLFGVILADVQLALRDERVLEGVVYVLLVASIPIASPWAAQIALPVLSRLA